MGLVKTMINMTDINLDFDYSIRIDFSEKLDVEELNPGFSVSEMSIFLHFFFHRYKIFHFKRDTANFTYFVFLLGVRRLKIIQSYFKFCMPLTIVIGAFILQTRSGIAFEG